MTHKHTDIHKVTYTHSLSQYLYRSITLNVFLNLSVILGFDCVSPSIFVCFCGLCRYLYFLYVFLKDFESINKTIMQKYIMSLHRLLMTHTNSRKSLYIYVSSFLLLFIQILQRRKVFNVCLQ